MNYKQISIVIYIILGITIFLITFIDNIIVRSILYLLSIILLVITINSNMKIKRERNGVTL